MHAFTVTNVTLQYVTKPYKTYKTRARVQPRVRNSLVMMWELEMEGRAVGIQLGLGDGTKVTLEEIEPMFQGGAAALLLI